MARSDVCVSPPLPSPPPSSPPWTVVGRNSSFTFKNIQFLFKCLSDFDPEKAYAIKKEILQETIHRLINSRDVSMKKKYTIIKRYICDHMERRTPPRFKKKFGRPNCKIKINIKKWKQTMCHHIQNGTTCPYGDNCNFAHNEYEQRVQGETVVPKKKQEELKELYNEPDIDFTQYKCPWGENCHKYKDSVCNYTHYQQLDGEDAIYWPLHRQYDELDEYTLRTVKRRYLSILDREGINFNMCKFLLNIYKELYPDLFTIKKKIFYTSPQERGWPDWPDWTDSSKHPFDNKRPLDRGMSLSIWKDCPPYGSPHL